jgi:hypothetical protein
MEEHELLEILFLATKSGNISAPVLNAWFSLLRDSLFFSNQRNVQSDTDNLSEIMQTVQALSAIISIQFASLPGTDLGTSAWR